MNNNLPEQFVFDHLKNSRSNKIRSISNFSFDSHLLRELNGRYLDNINLNDTNIGSGFSTFVRPKDYDHHSHKPEENLKTFPPKCNKWCTAHVRISWIIYHQQQHSKEKLYLSDKKKEEEEQESLLNNRLSHFVSNTKSNFPFSSNNSFSPPFNDRSQFDVCNNSFNGLDSLFSMSRKSDMNGSISSLNVDSLRFYGSIQSLSSINQRLSSLFNNNDNHRNCSDNLTNKYLLSSLSPNSNLDNWKSSSHNFLSTLPNFHPLTHSIIERQRLSAAYTSLFASISEGKTYFPTTINPLLYFNNNSSHLVRNINPSIIKSPLIQPQHFLNSLCLSQEKQEGGEMIEHKGGIIVKNNNLQINKRLKTKFESTNKEQRKRIKVEHPPISPISNTSTSSSIKSKHLKHQKQFSSLLSINSTIQNSDLTSKEVSVPSISTAT